MTLSVDPFLRTPAGAIRWLDHEPGHNDLAGVESARDSFYGSQAALDLELTLLPQLKSGSIFAEGEELTQLEDEVHLLLANLAVVCMGDRTGYWEFRLNNILSAARVARQNEGGVCIE